MLELKIYLMKCWFVINYKLIFLLKITIFKMYNQV